MTSPMDVLGSMSPTMLRTLQNVAGGKRVTNQARIRDLFHRGLITIRVKDSRMIPETVTPLGAVVLRHSDDERGMN